MKTLELYYPMIQFLINKDKWGYSKFALSVYTANRVFIVMVAL